ncbi:MAG: hypothetical protein M3Q65_05890 [Chloroflexota bacterium]|nr:hypothetical protein [Chloroflexota bacterium]
MAVVPVGVAIGVWALIFVPLALLPLVMARGDAPAIPASERAVPERFSAAELRRVT